MSIRDDIFDFVNQESEVSDKLFEAFVLPKKDKEALITVKNYLVNTKSQLDSFADVVKSLQQAKKWIKTDFQTTALLASPAELRQVTQPDIRDLLQQAADNARDSLETIEQIVIDVYELHKTMASNANSVKEAFNEFGRDVKMGRM